MEKSKTFIIQCENSIRIETKIAEPLVNLRIMYPRYKHEGEQTSQSELANYNFCSFHVAHESFSSFDYIPEGAHQSGTLYIPIEPPRVSKVEAHLAVVIAAAKAKMFLTLVLCVAVSACSWPAKQIAVEDVQNLHYQHVDIKQGQLVLSPVSHLSL